MIPGRVFANSGGAASSRFIQQTVPRFISVGGGVLLPAAPTPILPAFCIRLDYSEEERGISPPQSAFAASGHRVAKLREHKPLEFGHAA